MKKILNGWKFLKRLSSFFEFMNDERISVLKKLKVIGLLIFAFAYFISPIDVVPEVVLGFGFLDDGVVMLYIFSVLNDELDKYEKFNFDSRENVIDFVDYKIKDENSEFEKKED